MTSLESLEEEARRVAADPVAYRAMGRQPESRAKLGEFLAQHQDYRLQHAETRNRAIRAVLATDAIIAAMRRALDATQGEVDA